jgi:hypothetical protein
MSFNDVILVLFILGLAAGLALLLLALTPLVLGYRAVSGRRA